MGPHTGKKVQDAKKLIQGEMVASGEAVLYQEPERTVITRSGDQCVVALTDQWWVHGLWDGGCGGGGDHCDQLWVNVSQSFKSV